MHVRMDPGTEKQLRKSKYGVWNHSAVQICSWTKKSLHDQDYCYKQKFYGIDCHRCMEFSPSAALCGHNCVFCWRPMEFMRFDGMEKGDVDGPEDIHERLLEERRKLLSGFKGDGITNMKKYAEALAPNHFAISLSGEPTLYPRLPEMVSFLKGLPGTRSIFIVTNGQEPGMMEKLIKEDGLPTQMYISVNAPNRMLFEMISRPAREDAWDRFLRSLEIYSRMKTRRIMRMTMIKGLNMDDMFIGQYADLVRKANPHFIEIKAYMWIGFSRKRLGNKNMPFHVEIKEYARKLAKETGFSIVDEKRESRIVLLQNPEGKIERTIE